MLISGDKLMKTIDSATLSCFLYARKVTLVIFDGFFSSLFFNIRLSKATVQTLLKTSKQ